MYQDANNNHFDSQSVDAQELECPFNYEVGMAGEFDCCYYCELFEECEKLS